MPVEVDHVAPKIPGLVRHTFLDVLALDPRPTLVIDAHSESAVNVPVFWNPACEQILDLTTVLQEGLVDSTLDEHSWTSFQIEGRWTVIAANLSPTADLALTRPSATPKNDLADKAATTTIANLSSLALLRQSEDVDAHREPLLSSIPTRLSVDTSVSSIPRKRSFPHSPVSRIHGDSAYVNFFRDFHWASTELGSIETWSTSLVETCNLMLASPDPVGVYWGERPIAIYNEATIATIGDRHPNALGRHVDDVFPEVWEGHFKPVFESIRAKQEPWVQYNDRRVGYHDGRLEEVFWKVTFVPIHDDEDTVGGIWAALHDVTTEQFWQRRIATLFRLTASINATESFDAMWSAFVGGFEIGDRDVPHLLIYTALEGSASPYGSQSTTVYNLEKSVGYDANQGPYQKFDLSDDSHALARLFRQAMVADAPVSFEKANADLDPQFWDAFLKSNLDDICKTIVVIPICPVQAKGVSAYLVVGVNPLVRYDRDYHEFIDLARRQISSTMASILLRKEEISRERLVAEEASAQLALWKAEAELQELRFTRLAETAPIGICTYAPDGSLTYANDVYREIFAVTANTESSGASWWADLVYPDDLDMAKIMFSRLLLDRQAVTFEIRVKAQPGSKATPSDEGFVWVLVSAYAEPTGNGPQTVIACFTDINEQKRAEDQQSRRLEDMINAKRQQEAFIDMTSHEIRNPLSVVLHCGEEIISTCTSLRTKPGTRSSTGITTALEEILDAAETIEFCTLHQKRIVDDILTLSKLESDLLPVTPEMVQPLTLVEGITKLFEREIRKSDMQMEINIHPTFLNLQLHQVWLDPSRVSQIIINLLSNAIKFTKTQNERRLTLLLGGSTNNERPSSDWPVSYLERQQPAHESLFTEYWNSNESAHFHFAVTDTGAGMSVEEQQKIFSRFTQASSRTHVKYGGSGLGLYICRALSETHGGQIGCESTPKKGSSFGFHVEVGRSPLQMQRGDGQSGGLKTNTPSLTYSSKNANAVPRSSGVALPSPMNLVAVRQPDGNPRQPTFHILIVEDNILNQKVLRRQLEKAGNTVVVAHHGQDALDLLRTTRAWNNLPAGDKQPFDFILMDVEMPVMNGLVCTQKIREYEEKGLLRGHVPIIATTGNARDEHTGMAMSAGMDQVVLKPYSLSVLLPIAERLRQQYGSMN